VNSKQLVVRSLVHYWRTNLAIVAGVVAGTAVIGGALVVGDSVRGSLRQMSLDRLGHIDHSVSAHRYFREQLADQIASQPEFSRQFEAIAPALMLQGSLEHTQQSTVARVAGVQIFGVDQRMWSMTAHGSAAVPDDGKVILSHGTAEQLGVSQGDRVTMWVELPSSIPRDSLLGEREELSREIELQVQRVLGRASGVGRLALNPNQQQPKNAFVALSLLQDRLDLSQRSASRRNPVPRPARVNSLFVRSRDPQDGAGDGAVAAAATLTKLLSQSWELADLGLRVSKNPDRGILALESERMVLEDMFASAAERAAEQQQRQTSPVLIALSNQIANAKRVAADQTPETEYSMYSLVAGVNFPADKPFGPLPGLSGPPLELEPDEAIINAWLAEDLGVTTGDTISIRYHQVGSHGELPEKQLDLVVRQIVPLEGVAADRGLTPRVDGITNIRSIRDWDQPFPMEIERITERDEQYWETYGPTPKVFLSLDRAQELWRSRYGALTSFRVSDDPQSAQPDFAAEVLGQLTAAEVGLAFQPVKYQGLQAAVGANDFTQLFLAFSFFLIFSATTLIALLFRLNVERRSRNVGLLSAVGFTPKQVGRLFLAEALLVVLTGGLLGVLAAVGYAELMVYGLKTWWRAAMGTQHIHVYLRASSLAAGALLSVVTSLGVVWWALRQLKSASPRGLLTGAVRAAADEQMLMRRRHRLRKTSIGLAALAALLLIVSVAGLVPGSEAFSGFSWRVVCFFLIGICLLSSNLMYLSLWLQSDHWGVDGRSGWDAVGRLGIRNARRNRQRSVATVALIACATFVIVAVAAGHRNPAVERPDLHSGNGGFTLVAESSQPILFDLNTESGRDRLDFQVGPDDDPGGLIERMDVQAFRVKAGEDASCLNLYQTRVPTILGATPAMIRRGGFKFADTPAEHPWRLLTEAVPDQDPDQDGVPVIPVLGDMNTLMYSLKVGIGDTIDIPNADHPRFRLRVAGMFDGSVFQGVLIMSEQNFERVYPDEPAGYRYFLLGLAGPDADAASGSVSDAGRQLTRLLESHLGAYGFDVENVADRLANFLMVQNTYLTTFQTLGGLGLLLGTLGLATVMLRNVLERKSEVALLRAVGFRQAAVGGLVLWENAFLMVWGLVAGAGSAIIAMWPHVMTTGADVPWLSVGVMLSLVFITGMLSVLAAVAEAIKTPIVATLRSE